MIRRRSTRWFANTVGHTRSPDTSFSETSVGILVAMEAVVKE